MTSPRWRTAAIVVAGVVLGVGVGLDLEPGSGPISGLILAIIGVTALALVLITTSPEPATDAGSDATAWTEFRRELRRARRHDRPLTLIRIPRTDASDAPPADLPAASRRIGSRLRLVDRAWVDGDSVYVMLPESDRAAAGIVVDRLDTIAPDGSLAPARVATFPIDGLTSGAIIAAVHDAAVDGMPIPMRPTIDEPVMEDGLPVGETAVQR